ncbi:hypothetical protein TrRE_jg11199 [Triparma retinervis]|uniref:RRM domain-containing protein n=1 Tax=Triparma retinervis TaxID=2557542 RepID=A0A9W6ZTC1_9STRA|nr:hypothetical protein TrRE_jg11199 [Triparma retinervis]
MEMKNKQNKTVKYSSEDYHGTQKSRGFGFVVFKERATLTLVLSSKHHIHKRLLDVKEAAAKGEHTPTPYKGSQPMMSNKDQPQAKAAPKVAREEYKILVTRLHPDVTSEYLRVYFEEKMGGGQEEQALREQRNEPPIVRDCEVIWDSIKNSSRCFGYVWFAGEDTVEAALGMGRHVVMGKEVTVKNGREEQKVQRGNVQFNPYQVQMKRPVEACPPGENPAWFRGGKLYGRRGWKAGYGSFSFGPLGWAVDGWEGADQIPIEEYKLEDAWTGFSFKVRREDEVRKEREAMKREVDEARELDRKRQRRS